MERLFRSFALVAVATASILAGSANAADKYWDRNSTTAGAGSTTATLNGTWDTGTTANWTTSSAGTIATTTWTAGDRAIFAAGADSSGVSYNVTISATGSPHNVTGGLTVEEGNVTLVQTSGSAINIGSGTVRINDNAKLSIGLITSVTHTSGGGGVVLDGTLSTTLTSVGSSFYSANANITIGSSNTGTIDVPASTSDSRYGSASAGFILDNGTGNTTLTKSGAGTFGVQASGHTFSKLAVTGGQYRAGGSNTTSNENSLAGPAGVFGALPASFMSDNITLSGGGGIGTTNNLTLHNNRGITLGTGGGTLATDNTVTLTVPGAISGSGALSVGRVLASSSGSGTVTLSSTSNSWSGGTNVTDGTLKLGAAGVIPDASAVTLTGTGILDLNGNNETVGVVQINSSSARITGAGVLTGSSYDVRATNTTSSQGISANLGGTGSLTKSTSGAALLTAANSYSGSTTISAGTLSIDGDATLGNGAGTLNLSGGTLNTTATRNNTTDPVANPVNVTANSAITTTSAAATAQLNLSSNTIGGTGGTLTFRNDGADAATDEFQPRFTGNGFNMARPMVLASGNLNSIVRLSSFNGTGTTQTFSGDISGSGVFERNASSQNGGGETVFSGANTYTGGTNVLRGTLTINNATGSGTGSGAVVVGGTLANGVLQGMGTIITASGVAVNAGGALAGTLTFGSLATPTSLSFNGGTLAPGNSAGTITLAGGGAVVFDSASTLEYDLNGSDTTVGGGVNDLLTGVGDLTLGGTLNVTDIGPANSFASAPVGTSWRLINYTGTLTGPGLDLGTMPAIDPSLKFAIDTSMIGQVNLTIQNVPEASAFIAVGLVGAMCWFARKRLIGC
jgi:autotransporter-associated beta strand protein